MSQPEVGRTVLWFPDGDRSLAPHVGIVTAVGNETVCLNILSPDTMYTRIRDGARHMDDPLVKRAETREQGGWDYTERDKMLDRLITQLEKALE